MESRKEKTASEEHSKAFDTYINLKRKRQGSRTDEAILQYLVRNMEQRKEVPSTLLAIIELLRINAPKCVLNREEKHSFFSLLIEILPKEKINLERFIKYRIPSLLTNKTLMLKLVTLVGVVSGTARRYLKEIIIILMEECGEEMLGKVLEIVLLNIPRDPTLNDIIEATKDVSMPVVGLIMEQFDDKTYADVYASLIFNKDLCIRNIKGANRMKYIRAAMSEKNFSKLCNFYIGDRDKKVVEYLAASYVPVNMSIFYRLLMHPDENVRVALMERLNFEDAVRFDLEMHERALDTSPRVRSLAFEMFKLGADMYMKYFVDAEGVNENAQQELSQAVLKYFLRFIQSVLKGVLTKQRDEYIKVLQECNLPWEFYFQIRSYKGLDEYLTSVCMEVDLPELPRCDDMRRFYLKYFFRKEMSKENVFALIEQDVYSALIYLGDKDLREYVECLITRGLNGGVNETLVIVELIHPYLHDRIPMSSPNLDAELLIYAHSKYSFAYVEEVSKLSPSFPVLYFLAHMKVPTEVMFAKLSSYRGSCEEHIEIQLAYNDRKLLRGFVDYFLGAEFRDDMGVKLVKSRTFVGSMIYFICTGRVNIRNIDFFISSIHFMCMNATNTTKVKQIYEIYVMKVDQKTFDRFYSVCLRLKHMTLNGSPHSVVNDKVMVGSNDKLLYSLCDMIVNLREGAIVDEAFNLCLFHEIPRRLLDLILLGHVV